MAKRPSPNSVICIDLTESDEEGENSLDTVRKRLKGTTFPSNNNSTNSDDDAVTIVKVEGASGGSSNIGSVALLQNWTSEVQVVEPVAPEIHAVAPAAAAADDSDDVVLVGTANESRLPHMRQHCPDNKFVQDVVALNRQSHMTAIKRKEVDEGKTGNVSFCDLCYCFVCDKPAKDCISWGTVGHANYSLHCHASDAGMDARIWKNKRNNVKNGVGSTATTYNPPTPTHNRWGIGPFGGAFQEQDSLGDGPFPPDHAQAAQSPILTQCRCCGWYNRFSHRNYTREVLSGRQAEGGSAFPISAQDWCQSCGRIASLRDFGKLQSKPYTSTVGDVFLGQRIIPFTLVAHDPRQMAKYQEKWTSHGPTDPKWQYSQATMEEEMFKHRFGKYPRIEMILESISVLDEVPKDSGNVGGKSFRLHYNDEYPREGKDDYRYDASKYDADGYRDVNMFPDLAPDETEALVLTNPTDRIFLEGLKTYGIGSQPDQISSYIGGDIVAKWNREARSGNLSVRVFLKQRCFGGGGTRETSHSITRFLGGYFNVFPFSLMDVAGSIRAEEVARPETSNWSVVADLREQRGFDKIADEMKQQVQNHNDSVKAKSDKLSLNTSASSKTLGGTCPSETGFKEVLTRYYRETFADDMVSANRYRDQGRSDLWADHGRGIVSSHRQLRESVGSLDPRRVYSRRLRSQGNLDAYLSDKERIFAVSNMTSDCKEIINNTQSMKGLLEHLENLHHSSVPFVEGLNVELLEFQRQSVQWALERETTPGGIQSFLWAKLPSVAEPGQDLYYSPILERFRRDKPRLVRGGFICEEMGLGKTVISLALILQNPAPAVPQSGSAVTVLNNAATAAGAAGDKQTWDKDLYARTSVLNEKRGSIISRGTLVVCHVSLVGQWIDEAKSKLSDPGLVYPYHGQSRKRNAAMLAQNAIVVTTYQTLASDATYHAKKGGDDYCAPCEQVRWWRVICDESHSLREASTKKSMAVMNLVADHKWLVSGTPVNTTFNDLKNQLKFIGLEDVPEMFGVFLRTAFKHTNDPSVPKRSNSFGDASIGPFMFLLRAIMMRHTQKQTYRGTTTTLMALPPKTERTVEVEFSEEEKKEYTVLDSTAHDFYTSFKERKGHKLSKHYLLLTQKLMPLRIAASGGRIPLDDEEEKTPGADGEEEEKVQDADGESDAESEDESPEPKKKKAKKEKRYSEFAYTSKLNALIAELESARDEDANAKSLVFSQFTSTLKFLQQELPKHGFQYRTLSGDMSMKKRAKALHDFQHDPPTTVFLLSMRAGAVGINLTQANRVFLMEPSFNPALEAQAIGRVHRLGQKRNVEIVRFTMKDSVEGRILKMLEKKYSGGEATNDEPVEVDKKARRAVTPLVGSIHTDRAAVVGAEFDILFGVATDDAKMEHGEDSAAMDFEMDFELDDVGSSQDGVSSGFL